MATLKEISELCGVSIRTVNRVLKNDGYCAPETKEKVLAASKQLGYVPNLAARSLKTGKSMEVCVTGFSDSSISELDTEKVYAFQETMFKAGYHVSVLFHPEEDVANMIRQRSPAGIWIMANTKGAIRKKLLDSFENSSVPIVESTAHRQLNKNMEYGHITIDRPQGVYDAVKYMYETGRRKIAFCSSEKDYTRFDGYNRAVKELNLDPIIYITEESNGFKSGIEAAQYFINESITPDAIQCNTDVMAMGLLGELKNLGVEIPSDIAVVGFDNRSASKYSTPPMTTVAQPNHQVGITAAEVLLEMIASPGKSVAKRDPIPTELIIREST